MSFERLNNHIRLLAELAADTRAHCVAGIVTSYDPNYYSAKVKLQPDDTLTGWLPVLSPWVGNGWGIVCPPTPGDHVMVHFLEGSHQYGLVDTRFFNDQLRPPPLPGNDSHGNPNKVTAPSGEFWLVHKSGSFLKFTNDNKLTLSDKAGSLVVLNGDGTGVMTFASGLTINSDITVNGKVTATGEGTFNGGHTVSQHTHTQPNDAHGDAEQPTNKPTG